MPERVKWKEAVESQKELRKKPDFSETVYRLQKKGLLSFFPPKTNPPTKMIRHKDHRGLPSAATQMVAIPDGLFRW
ncbi:MAG: hypothetical protein H0T73_23500 [Ardenticatenales bacterium]|nr:hypothetical protein [Ardenticatenales bacterium]